MKRLLQMDWPLLSVLLIVATIILQGVTSGEFHFYGDEMRHAMSGVFFRDAMVDLPIQHPLRYTLEYYAKYPALGLVYWPPFFYFVEGIFFLVFGISVVSSRLAVLLFALLGVYYWYRIAETQGPRYRAILSSLIFPLIPFVLTYEKVTMLEIPVLALSLATIYYWQSFLKTEKAADLWRMALFLTLAFLTNQKAVFLAIFLVVHFLFSRRFRLLLRWQVWLAAVLSIAVVLPWYVVTLNRLALSYERVAGRGFSHASSGSNWMYYLNRLPDQLGIVLTCLGIAGVLWALIRAPRRHGLLLIWIASSYVCFTLIQEKTPRHTMFWIPPLVYFGIVSVEILFARRKAAIVAATALALFYTGNAMAFETQKIGGMDEIARFVVSLPESDVVYYQGFLNGNFIFHMRKHDPEKKHFIAREKQVTAIRVYEGYGRRRILETSDEVLEFFRNWGIRYAVVENFEPYPGLSPVRQALNSGEFELVRAFTIWGSHENFQGRRILVYRLHGEINRQKRIVTLPMLTLRDDIQADLDRLSGKPWPN